MICKFGVQTDSVKRMLRFGFTGKHWARDSFPAFGEAKETLLLAKTKNQIRCSLALSKGGEGGSALRALTGEV